jgi:hypothetical protein
MAMLNAGELRLQTWRIPKPNEFKNNFILAARPMVEEIRVRRATADPERELVRSLRCQTSMTKLSTETREQNNKPSLASLSSIHSVADR